MKVLKGIRNILIVILILGWVTAGYDYYRISRGDQPVFCIKSFDKKNKFESYRGLYYIVERTLKEKQEERFDLSRKDKELKELKNKHTTQLLKIKILWKESIAECLKQKNKSGSWKIEWWK